MLTSEANTQEIGPKLRENMILVINIIAIPARCAAKFVSPLPAGKEQTMALKTENVHTKLAAPNRSGRLRPIRSRRSVMKLE